MKTETNSGLNLAPFTADPVLVALLAVVIVVRPAVDEPEWHLRCPHCGGFTLVCVGRIPRTRAPPAGPR